MGAAESSLCCTTSRFEKAKREATMQSRKRENTGHKATEGWGGRSQPNMSYTPSHTLSKLDPNAAARHSQLNGVVKAKAPVPGQQPQELNFTPQANQQQAQPVNTQMTVQSLPAQSQSHPLNPQPAQAMNPQHASTQPLIRPASQPASNYTEYRKPELGSINEGCPSHMIPQLPNGRLPKRPNPPADAFSSLPLKPPLYARARVRPLLIDPHSLLHEAVATEDMTARNSVVGGQIDSKVDVSSVTSWAQHHNRAVKLQSEGKLEEAMAMFQEAATLQRTLLGEDHPDVALTLYSIGNICKQLGRDEDARICFTRTVNIYRLAYGNDDIRTRDAQRLLSSIAVTAMA